jgi:hypothetical protein
MTPPKKKVVASEKKLDNILSSVESLSKQVYVIDQRLSKIEHRMNSQSYDSVSTLPSEPTDSVSKPEVDFNDKDEMLKRAYDVLASAPRPLTTQEVADKIGRSRSATSQYLNELHQRNLLLKTQGTTPDKSRNILFCTIDLNQKENSDKLGD